MLEILLKSLSEWIGDLMKSYELANAVHLSVVACCSRVQSLDDGGDVSEDGGIHQS